MVNNYLEVEYAYGYNFNDDTGIFKSMPGHHTTFSLSQRILLGKTKKTAPEIEQLVNEISQSFKGKDYHLLLNNCNHFSNTLATLLLGTGIPSYINRISQLGNCLSCFLPAKVLDCVLTEDTPILEYHALQYI